MSDTSPKVREAYFRRLAEMAPEERVNIAVALWVAGDALQRAGIRHLYPDAGEDEITFQLAVKRFGAELARRVYRRQ